MVVHLVHRQDEVCLAEPRADGRHYVLADVEGATPLELGQALKIIQRLAKSRSVSAARFDIFRSIARPTLSSTLPAAMTIFCTAVVPPTRRILPSP